MVIRLNAAHAHPRMLIADQCSVLAA